MFRAFQRVAVSSVVKTVADLTIPNGATRAHLQSEATSGIRYTMDGVTDPTTTSGMILRSVSDPLDFLIDDVRKIRFVRDGAADTALLIHYV